MSSVNKAIILGRLGADPDVRYTQANQAVANMSIATSERYTDSNGQKQEETQWHRVVAWGRTAEIAQEYLSKGDQVYIEGPIKTRSWEDKDGTERWTTEVTALRLVLLGSGKGKSGSGGRPPYPAGQKAAKIGKGAESSGSEQPVDSKVDLSEGFDDMDDDLPF